MYFLQFQEGVIDVQETAHIKVYNLMSSIGVYACNTPTTIKVVNISITPKFPRFSYAPLLPLPPSFPYRLVCIFYKWTHTGSILIYFSDCLIQTPASKQPPICIRPYHLLTHSTVLNFLDFLIWSFQGNF